MIRTSGSIAILLFALTTEMLTERIGIDHYLQLITDVHKFYDTSCIIFVQCSRYQDLNTTTLIFTWTREFSRRRVMTLTTTFSDLVSRYNEYRKIVQPLFVVLLDNGEAMNDFARATNSIKPISFPVWFVIFLQHPSKPLERHCRRPSDNVFNVDFSTVMLVLCYDNPVLTEWYAISDNRTRTFELATWSLDKGLNWNTQQSLYARRSDLFGAIMRVASVDESAFMLLENGTVTGFLGLLLLELSRVMNFSMQILQPVEAYGSWNAEKKVWTGAIGQLVADVADIGVSEFTVTTRRFDAVDFTLPLIQSRNRVYFRQPGDSDVQWSAYFKAFSSEIWTAIVSIIVCAPILLTVIKTRGRFSSRLMSENYLHVWGIFCQQGLSEFPNESSMRLAFLSIFISALIVSSAYSASLISFLTLTTASLPFSTLEGYVEDGSYKLIVIKNSADYDMFIHAQDPVLRRMNATMKKWTRLPLMPIHGFEQVCQDKAAFYTTEVLKDAVDLYLPCKVVFIETGRADSMAMTLRKGSPYTGVMNYHLRRFLNNGVLNRLKQKYLLRTNPPETTHDMVGLWGIAPILAVVAGGMVLATLILMVEKAYYAFNIRFHASETTPARNSSDDPCARYGKLQGRGVERNAKSRKLADIDYARPVGYWP